MRHDESKAMRHEGVEYWHVERAARYLDVSTKRIYQLIEQGLLAGVRLGPRQLRVTRASLQEFIARCPQEAANNNES